VYYEVCDEIVTSFAHFGATPTGSDLLSIVKTRGDCVAHATQTPSPVRQPTHVCRADGTWERELIQSTCSCDAGYWPNANNDTCTRKLITYYIVLCDYCA
jgi:hypothetical protein